MDQKKTISVLTTCSFLLCVGVLSVTNAFSEKEDFSENENRVLAKAPELRLQSFFSGNFDDQFESWFSDHFVGRSEWIASKAWLKKSTGSIENNGVFFAKNGSLVQQHLTYDESIAKNNIQYVQEFCEDNGITGNVMLVPSEADAKQSQLPFGAYSIDEKELFKTIESSAMDLNYLSVREELKAGKDVYFKTDHHWNAAGAYLGYETICKDVLNKEPEVFDYKQVKDDFKGTMYSKSGAFWEEGEPMYEIVPKKKVEVNVTMEDGTTYDSLFFSDNLLKKDAYTYYLDGNHAYEKIQTNVENDKKAVIVKDSYSHILIPYLASEYSEIQIVDLRYYRQGVSSLIEDKENTDFYVIYSMDTFCSDTNLAALW